ncbi:MAG: DUF4443 domain-containing protein [Candidatus Micrarchaeota archaeon]
MDFSIFSLPSKTSGPLPKFVLEDVLRAFWLIGRKKLVGRKDLGDSLDLGEGTARSVTAFLCARGFAKKIRGGCLLSEKGTLAFKKLCSIVVSTRQLPPLYSTFERPSFCMQCSLKTEPSVSKSIVARDAAIKAGSDGLLSLLFKNKKFLFLGTNDAVAQKDAKLISGAFFPSEGQIFILSFARNPLARERGAWAALLSLSKE